MRACICCFSLWMATYLGAPLAGGETDQAVPSWERQIPPLVRQLNDPHSATRDEAEASLLELAPVQSGKRCDHFLDILPRPEEHMPPEVLLRLTRLRRAIQNRISTHALAASRFTLAGETLDLAALLQEIQSQTGNRLQDYRDRFGQPATPQQIKITLENEPFWQGLDQILDQAQLSCYPYAGDTALAIVGRAPGARDRYQRACYAGAFRIAATQVMAQRDLRRADGARGQIELEIAWEPRLQPIAFSQPAETLQLVAADQTAMRIADARPEFTVEVQPGSSATALQIPFVLPQRSVASMDVLRGQLSALVPGRRVEFRFTDLQQSTFAPQRQGDMEVFLGPIRRNGSLWEVSLRLRVHSEEAALESHRGWVFRNRTYLRDSAGHMIEHTGFETTKQTEREVGLVYFFKPPANAELGDCTWVYHTPASLVRLPIPFELHGIRLP